MRNLAFALRNGVISGSLAAQTLEELAGEVEEVEKDAAAAAAEFEEILTPEQAARILRAIQEEDARLETPKAATRKAHVC
jgi:signal transduction histidine kinase